LEHEPELNNAAKSEPTVIDEPEPALEIGKPL